MEKISKSTVAFAATALGLGLVGVGPAFAQDADGGDIVVTARRIEERLQDVPISITVFNQSELDNRNITNPAELATYTPSLQSNSQFGSSNASFSIRGFVQDNFTAPSVGVYFADVISPRGAASVTSGDGAGPGSMFDLQNVQVLKGPQGTLFGRNTTGGAILLVPQKPTYDFGGYIEDTAGNYSLTRQQGVLNVPLGDRARMRIGVDRMMRDGYLNNIGAFGPDHFGDVDYIAGRISFVADLAPNLENYTILNYTHSETSGFTQRVTDCNPAARIASSGQILPSGQYSCAQVARLEAADDFYAVENAVNNPRNELEQWQAINTTTWTASDNLTIKNIFSYAELENFQRSSVFGNYWIVNTNVPQPGVNTVRAGFQGTVITPAFIGNAPDAALNHQSTLTEELQFQGRALDERLNWQAGVYYEASRPLDDRVGTMGFNNANCASIGYNPVTNTPDVSQCVLPYNLLSGLSRSLRRTEYTDVGIYGQGTYELTDQLNLTVGLRYTDDNSRSLSQAYNYNFAGGFPLGGGNNITCSDAAAGATEPECTLYQNQHSNATTGVIDLEYHPVENLMLYGKYSRGYRQGLVNPRSTPPYDSFGQEQVDTYEVGFKTSWHGSMPGYVNFATFYNELQNQQLLISFLDAGGRTNASVCACGTSEVYGAELDGSISLFDGFRLTGGLAYLNTELKKFAAPTPPAGYITVIPGNEVGESLAYSPDWKASLTASYRLPLPETVGGVTLAATYSYTGDYVTKSSDHGGVDSFNTLNLNLNWDNVGGSPVDFSIFGTNVTDEEYYTFSNDLYDQPAGVSSSLGFVSKVQGEPRMWGARLRYHFGADAH